MDPTWTRRGPAGAHTDAPSCTCACSSGCCPTPELDADLVVDASGRAGRATDGVRAPVSVGGLCGIAYVDRQYRLREGAEPGPLTNPLAWQADFDGYQTIVFLHERGYFSVLLVRPGHLGMVALPDSLDEAEPLARAATRRAGARRTAPGRAATSSSTSSRAPPGDGSPTGEGRIRGLEGAPGRRSAGCGNSATLAHMTTVASRDLRNHTAEVLRTVAEGTRVTVTVNGRPVAEIAPVSGARPMTMPRAELVQILNRHQADSGMRKDLAALGDETTDWLP